MPHLQSPQTPTKNTPPNLCSMPNEVLVTIFGHLLHSHIYEQHKMGESFGLRSPSWRELQVCRHIWSAAVHTPVLWSLVSLGILFHGPERGSDWTSLCIIRSGQSLITVSLALFFASSSRDKRFDDFACRTRTLNLGVHVSWGSGCGNLAPVDTFTGLPQMPCLEHLVIYNCHLISPTTFHRWLSHSSQLVSLDLRLRHHPVSIANLEPINLPHLCSIKLRGHPTEILLVLRLLPDPHEELCIHCERVDYRSETQAARSEQRRLLDVVLAYWDRQILPHASRFQYILLLDCTGRGENARNFGFHPAESSISTPPSRLSVYSTLGDLDFIRCFGRIADTVCIYATSTIVSSVLSGMRMISENVQHDWAISAVFFAPWAAFWSQSSEIEWIEMFLECMKNHGRMVQTLMVDATELGPESSNVAQWIKKGWMQEIRLGVTFSHDIDLEVEA